MIYHPPNNHYASPIVKSNDIEIGKVNHINFLGNTLDEPLSWKFHINKIHCKISKVIGIINHLKKYIPREILKLLYDTLIIPHLNYGLLVWGHKSGRIFKVQKKAVRSLTLSRYNAHTDPLFKSLKILIVQDMYNQQELNST